MPGANAAAGEPDGEAAAVVIAAHAGIAEFPLAEDGAAELGGEHDERVLEQAGPLQVLDQRGGGLIDVVALVGELARDRDMLVPAAMEQLHEPDVALEQAAGEEAIRRIAAGLAHLGAVGLDRGGGFVADVGQCRAPTSASGRTSRRRGSAPASRDRRAPGPAGR